MEMALERRIQEIMDNHLEQQQQNLRKDKPERQTNNELSSKLFLCLSLVPKAVAVIAFIASVQFITPHRI